MAIDRSVVEHIARLARLELSDEEIERYRGDLESILEYVGQIQSADTAGVSEELDPHRSENVLRDDEVRPGLTQEQALQNAPDTDGQHFRVPPVIGGRPGTDPPR